MYIIAICSNDDSCFFQLDKLISSYQTHCKYLLKVKHFNTYSQLLNPHNLNCDIFFLDNNISNQEKIKLTRSILAVNPKAYIIALVSSSDCFFSIYQNNIPGYIAKPIASSTFIFELDRALEHVLYHKDYLLIKNNFNIYRVYIKDICYIETCDRKVLVHTVNSTIPFYEKMQFLEDKLKNFFFYRCHNCYIINLEYLEKIISLDAYLVTGICIPISKNRKKKLVDKISTCENSITKV